MGDLNKARKFLKADLGGDDRCLIAVLLHLLDSAMANLDIDGGQNTPRHAQPFTKCSPSSQSQASATS